VRLCRRQAIAGWRAWALTLSAVRSARHCECVGLATAAVPSPTLAMLPASRCILTSWDTRNAAVGNGSDVGAMLAKSKGSRDGVRLVQAGNGGNGGKSLLAAGEAVHHQPPVRLLGSILPEQLPETPESPPKEGTASWEGRDGATASARIAQNSRHAWRKHQEAGGVCRPARGRREAPAAQQPGCRQAGSSDGRSCQLACAALRFQLPSLQATSVFTDPSALVFFQAYLGEPPGLNAGATRYPARPQVQLTPSFWPQTARPSPCASPEPCSASSRCRIRPRGWRAELRRVHG
jgi:hypothetical protein